MGVSTDALLAFAEHGIAFTVQDRAERPGAVLAHPVPVGGAALRRAQALAHSDGRALPIARGLVRAKLLHQSRLLKAWSRAHRAPPTQTLLGALATQVQGLPTLLPQASDRQRIMGVEAQGARLFWQGFSEMAPFRERRYPHAPDLVNQLLNYGYGVLARVWLHTVLQAGLDPQLGFLHADRLNRPSLVLDLMEPWRPAIVDRSIVGLIRQGVPLVSEQGQLTLDTRRRLLETLHRAMNARGSGRRLPLRALWVRNTRFLAASLVHGGGIWAPLIVDL
jgi:CRISPR-associated protein Cas1